MKQFETKIYSLSERKMIFQSEIQLEDLTSEQTEKMNIIVKSFAVKEDQMPDDALIVLGHQVKELSKSLHKLDYYLKGIEDILPS